MSKVQATREDVAALVGVSPVTVSRCFTNPDSVAPRRRAQILAAAAELGYHPNRGASLMRAGATGRLALIERHARPGWDWEGNRQYDYLFKATYHGVLAGLAESPYAMTYLSVSDDTQLAEALARVPMDGILGMNFEYPEEIAPIIESGIPCVFAHHARGLEGFNRCYTDNRMGGRLAGALLRETGHTAVAYVTYAPDRILTHGERLRGFREGLGEQRLALEHDPGERGRAGGLAAARHILDYLSSGGRLDAVAVLNDETALYVLQELIAAGVRVPGDLSVIGYDFNPAAVYLPFRLASVELNLEAVYHQAVSALIRTIKTGESIDIAVPPTLIPGDSVMDRRE